MDSEYLQLVRYKLQKRLKRLNAAEPEIFGSVFKQVWHWLHDNEIFAGILNEMAIRFSDYEKWVEKFNKGDMVFGDTEEQYLGICYYTLKKCVVEPRFAVSVGRRCSHHATRERIGNWRERVDKSDEYINTFLDVIVEPFFDYLDEQIDDRRAILALLKKFKQRCEWFQRERMYYEFREDTGQGEHKLAMRLYDYLHDQGIQFQIEPQSAGGRVDVISSQTGRDRLLADAKLFNPERGQNCAYLIKGFRQVYDYMRDYNEQFGYLVIFKTCAEDISIPAKHQEATVPFVTHNNKTIFFLVIDIYVYEESASKRGKLTSYEITPEQFVLGLEDKITPQTAPASPA